MSRTSLSAKIQTIGGNAIEDSISAVSMLVGVQGSKSTLSLNDNNVPPPPTAFLYCLNTIPVEWVLQIPDLVGHISNTGFVKRHTLQLFDF